MEREKLQTNGLLKLNRIDGSKGFYNSPERAFYTNIGQSPMPTSEII
ncbi:MAG: hypothetical protein Q8S01_04395 [Ignavibacteria bacterium]|nr:hypothetical protein [Ignavibacteria bacterium]